VSADLTERRQLILKLVIQEYIETANPVASETLVRKYKLGVSSATVRNELVVLEDLGYLTHLHTSAGRVPTDAGYRFFVENLMDRKPLSYDEQQTIRHQFYQVRTELDQWIHLAAAVLARTTQNASVVTIPRSQQARFKHLELIAIHEAMVLMVLVFHDGSVRQQMLTLESAHSQDELSATANRINEQCADADAERVAALLASLAPQATAGDGLLRHVLDLVVRSLRQLEDQLNEQIHSDGLIEMLSQPEFIPSFVRLDRPEEAERAVERMRRALEMLKSGKGIGALFPQVLASNGVQVVIGGELGQDDMREYSVVLARYGIGGEVSGVLGVIGPTRMAYPRSISTVRYISDVMSGLLGDLYGKDAGPPHETA
jgi:heat-inducible transcriptional repressor